MIYKRLSSSAASGEVDVGGEVSIIRSGGKKLKLGTRSEIACNKPRLGQD